MNQIISDAWANYQRKVLDKFMNDTTISNYAITNKEEFINKCKTNPEFSKTWGLKIEERELDMFERWKIADLTPNMMEIDYCNKLCDEHNVPTKLITITYNDKTIEMFLP